MKTNMMMEGLWKWFAVCLLLVMALAVAPGRAAEELDLEESVEIALQECLDGFTQDIHDQVQLELQLDELIDELKPLIKQERLFQRYRDNNRTDSMRCLTTLAKCNDANEFKEVNREGAKKRSSDRNVKALLLSHPLFEKIDREAAVVKRLSKNTDIQHTHIENDSKGNLERNADECTLDQCEKKRGVSITRQKNLRNQITKHTLNIATLKYAIMAWVRYGLLYRELFEECQRTLAQCQSGDRLLRVTVKNTGTLEFIRTWLGASASAITLGDFASSVFTNFQNVGVQQVDARFLQLHPDGVSTYKDEALAVSSEVALTLQVSAGALTISHLAVANGPTVLGAHLEVFDAQGNFILDPSNNKRSRKRYNWPNLDCDATGHPLPFSAPHVKHIESDEYWAAGSLHQDGVVKASITVEEVRFVVVYPESLGGGSSS